MQQTSAEFGRQSAVAFARCVADVWDSRLGANLLGVYLIGSLAHGGFGIRYSDIDMAVVAKDPLAPSDLQGMLDAAAAVSAEHAVRLSLFWTDRAFTAGRFPPLDRLDYLDHAVRLIEREAVRPGRPSLGEIRAYLRGAPFERWADKARQLSAAATLDATERKPYVRALLYPARFIYSWSTGTIASNDDAVAFLRESAPADLNLDLIEETLRCRRDGRDPDYLFSERGALIPHVAICARLIAAEPA
jgi:predicted nucleotidyltransferase